MDAAARVESGDPEAREVVDPAAVKEAAACVGQLLRTIKTCRLYDEGNPAVVRFREELAAAVVGLVSRRGSLHLEVGTSVLSWAGHDVLVAHSRDDNLAAVLHRDGIRSLALDPGIEPREVDALVDLILRVTGPSPGEDDLVTLLWDTDLPHVVVETVPFDGEADEGGDEAADSAPSVAWPRQDRGAAAAAPMPAAPTPAGSRSDDWLTGEVSDDPVEGFDAVESAALLEIARFQGEQQEADDESIVPATLRILNDCFASELTPQDREELAAFVPRVMREALALGDWADATAALRAVRTCDPHWTGEGFTRSLCGPLAITTRHAVSALDLQGNDGVESFLALAREFGPELAPWLMHVLAESQQKRVRRPLARTIGELLVGRPEQVLSWLSDDRWYVVRNAVHILGWIGGNDLVAHLRTAAEHPEPRVRREVVAALSTCEAGAARPVLMAMLGLAEADLFGTILHQLSTDQDPAVAERLLEMLRDSTFRGRTNDERRALFLALASRGEAILPALEEELFAGGGFLRRPDPDRQAVALCIARIGTPAAQAILERGLRSNHGSIRKACTIAGAGRGGAG